MQMLNIAGILEKGFSGVVVSVTAPADDAPIEMRTVCSLEMREQQTKRKIFSHFYAEDCC